MTDGEALLAAIRLFPDEDMPRLAYADWLDENDQPERAEFIRVQCELERIEQSACHVDCGFHGSDCIRCHDVARLRGWSQSIIDRNHFSTLGWDRVGFAPGRRHGYRVVTERVVEFSDRSLIRFSRGFVITVELPAADWLAHADAILTDHPVQEVTLTTMPPLVFNRIETRDDGQMRRFTRFVEWDERRVIFHRSASLREIGLMREPRGMTPQEAELICESMDPINFFKTVWPRIKKWNLPPERQITVREWVELDQAVLNAARENLRLWGNLNAVQPIEWDATSEELRRFIVRSTIDPEPIVRPSRMVVIDDLTE